ncbi:cytosine permease [Marinimicrobium sp. LS-A18]|uniref:purine-cytosine permease family protein n=1 Tax=Marinimicrobium sp. LS-A18 TaxID=1381596 RepID=UPI000467BC61|nr:nucleoside transporter [Marinimicrobium sp. LS-A18]
MPSHDEFEQAPLRPDQLKPARHFAASYAGEHVAGTEFVIGASFVAWGVGVADVLWGLLWGNLAAVLTWGLVCAPIAVDTRLTLYAYLKKIGGKGLINLYSVVNGLLFCVLAGAMITVSASAARILFGIGPQVEWYPTDPAFVAVALLVGAVVTIVSTKGFRRLAVFAQVCAPWMIMMFVVGGLTMLTVLRDATPLAPESSFLQRLLLIADSHIWRGDEDGLGLWHVAAFAWVANLAMHGGLSDMTILRYARKSSYGFLSVLGMFIGHYLAWVCAGVMGAGAALVLNTSIEKLDAGSVAYQALGATGILVVIIAGWTTSNPTIYRAGLAFQSLHPRWRRTTVTAITGAVTTVIACFPFVFTQLMSFVGLMGLILAPIGAVIVTEHWIFPRIGLTRYWNHYRQAYLNWSACLAWLLSLCAAWVFHWLGLHLFFLLIPTWMTATAVYTALAAWSGAAASYALSSVHEADEVRRKRAEQQYLNAPQARVRGEQAHFDSPAMAASAVVAIGSLLVCLGLGLYSVDSGNIDPVEHWVFLPTVTYMLSATLWSHLKEKHAQR